MQGRNKAILEYIGKKLKENKNELVKKMDINATTGCIKKYTQFKCIQYYNSLQAYCNNLNYSKGTLINKDCFLFASFARRNYLRETSMHSNI